jgi:hypothetical protein
MESRQVVEHLLVLQVRQRVRGPYGVILQGNVSAAAQGGKKTDPQRDAAHHRPPIVSGSEGMPSAFWTPDSGRTIVPQAPQAGVIGYIDFSGEEL